MLSESKEILSGQSLTTSIRTPSAQQPQKIQVTFETVYGEVEFFLKKRNSTIIIREDNSWIHIFSEDSKKTKRIALYKYELKEILEQRNSQSSDSEEN